MDAWKEMEPFKSYFEAERRRRLEEFVRSLKLAGYYDMKFEKPKTEEK